MIEVVPVGKCAAQDEDEAVTLSIRGVDGDANAVEASGCFPVRISLPCCNVRRHCAVKPDTLDARSHRLLGTVPYANQVTTGSRNEL